MTTKRLISFDWAMKRLQRKKASYTIFEGFLSELLRDDIKIKTILESESNRDPRAPRPKRVDLLVETGHKEPVIVDIQWEYDYDYLMRILFGTSKVRMGCIKRHMPYAKIRKIISISLVYFDLGVGEDYAYHGATSFRGMNKHDVLMLNNTQKELYKTEKIENIYPEYYVLKINRFDDIARNTIDEWIYFFKNEEIKDEFTAKGLKEAKEELDVMKLSEAERREYEDYLESLRYQASMFESSYKVGEMKGIKKGTLEMAKKLKEKGLDIDVISESSGLTKEEIENL